MSQTEGSKFIDGVKNDELRTMLVTHYTTHYTPHITHHCANTRGVETQVKRISFNEASIAIGILQN